MIQTIDVSHLCRLCALAQQQFVIDRICTDCWEGMHSGG